MRRIGFLALVLVATQRLPHAAAQTPVRETIHALAQEMVDCTKTHQDDRFVDLMYPPVVEMMGGHEKTKTAMQQAFYEMTVAGFKGFSGEIGQPSEPVAAGGKLFAIVPEVCHMTSPKVRLDQDSYMLAISLDQGKTWTFLDGAGITSERLKSLFPDFPPDLKLPERKQPKVTSL